MSPPGCQWVPLKFRPLAPAVCPDITNIYINEGMALF